MTQPSVLLTFRAENVRSFRDRSTRDARDICLGGRCCAVRPLAGRSNPIDVLPVAAIFGGNASGKTNVLKAMDDMRMHVLHSFRQAPTAGLPHAPFRLDPATAEKSSTFEIEIVVEGIRHDYGFELTRERVIRESAYRYPRGRAALLFERQGDKVEFGPAERARSRAVRDLLRPNALFLSTAAQANHPILLTLYEWFSRNLLLAEASSRAPRQAFTLKILEEDSEMAARVLDLLRAADLGITGARKYELDEETRERLQQVARLLVGQEEAEAPPVEPLLEDLMLLKHHGDAGEIQFGPHDESLGTLVWFGLVRPVVDALANGSVLRR